MAQRMSGFKSDSDRDSYFEMYDRFVEEHWPVPSAELDVDTSYGATHVRRSGSGDGSPIVMIHPTSGSSLGWHSIIEPLCADHVVYSPDTIGTIGRSMQTEPIESPGDLVVWLDEVLDSLELERAHLLGYSEGGWIAGLHGALSDGRERLLSLTLIEPSGAIERVPAGTLASLVVRGARTLLSRDKPGAIRDFNTWMNGDIALSDDEVELVLAAFRTFRQRLPNPTRLLDGDLESITAPTLLLLAANTRLYDPATVAKRAEDLVPQVEIEVFPHAGHGLPFQYPDEVLGAVLAFIDSHEIDQTS